MPGIFDKKGKLIIPEKGEIQLPKDKVKRKKGEIVVNEAYCPKGHSLISDVKIDSEKALHFIYVNKKSLETKPAVQKFVDFYLDKKNLTGLVKEVGYVPLPDSAIAAIQKRFKNKEIGTGFTGLKSGISVEAVLKEKLVY